MARAVKLLARIRQSLTNEPAKANREFCDGVRILPKEFCDRIRC